MAEKKSKELPPGAMIVEPGSAKKYETGSWRSKTPEVNKEKCTDCLFCWIYCPDNCIIVKDEKMKGFKLTHCKGCGICATQCPVKAITMKEEGA